MPLTALEQLVLEMINRARLDPAGEAKRLGFSLNEGLRAGTLSSSAKQPLAPSDDLTDAARGHSRHMIAVDKFAHDGIGDGTIASRMTGAGYTFTGAWTRGENIAFNGTTGSLDQTAFGIKNQNDLYIDKDYAGRGHRINILNDNFKEAGIGHAAGAYKIGTTSYNAAMLTTDFAASGTDVFITGVTINDRNGNNFYDIGEARSGVTVAVKSGDAIAGRAASTTSGGYAVAVDPGLGSVEVTFSGGGLSAPVSAYVTVGTKNIKLDLASTSEVLSSASTTLGDGAKALTLLGVASLSGTGNAGANTLVGNKGSNVLQGLGGGDSLYGKDGADTLIGGASRDVLTGGTGRDKFRFTDVDDMGNSSTTRDVITDFKKTTTNGFDLIDLSLIDAQDGAGAANDAFAFKATKGAAFTGIGQIRWFQEDRAGTANDKTIIEGNVDADLAADFQIELKGLVALKATDFVL